MHHLTICTGGVKESLRYVTCRVSTNMCTAHHSPAKVCQAIAMSSRCENKILERSCTKPSMDRRNRTKKECKFHALASIQPRGTSIPGR